MEENFEKYKKNRISLCSYNTKLTNQNNNCSESDDVDFKTLKELIDQLNIKLDKLKEIDVKIELLIKLNDYGTEIVSIH